MTAMHDEHLQDHYLHLSTHRKVLDFDPRNTENPIVLDYLMNPAEHNARMDRMKSISMSEINPYVTLMTPVIPPSYRVLMQENVMLWVALIHRMVFDERLILQRARVVQDSHDLRQLQHNRSLQPSEHRQTLTKYHHFLRQEHQ